MTRGDWHWLSIGWCVLVSVAIAAVFGHKVHWAKDTLWRERFRHYVVMALAGAAVGWAYFYVALPIGAAGVGVMVVPVGGWILGLFILCFVVCLPFTGTAWLHIWMFEHILQPKIRQRWDDQRKAERRIRRAQLGIPQEDD